MRWSKVRVWADPALPFFVTNHQEQALWHQPVVRKHAVIHTANMSSHHSIARSRFCPTPPIVRFCGMIIGFFSPLPLSPSNGVPWPRQPCLAKYCPVSSGMVFTSFSALSLNFFWPFYVRRPDLLSNLQINPLHLLGIVLCPLSRLDVPASCIALSRKAPLTYNA